MSCVLDDIRTKDDGGGGDNWSYKTCEASVKSSPPTYHHPDFNKPDGNLFVFIVLSLLYAVC